MKVTTRVYETSDGELVLEGDERARFLKFGQDTELAGEEAAKVAALYEADDRTLTEPVKVEAKDAALADKPAEQVKPVRKRAVRKPRSTAKRAEPKA